METAIRFLEKKDKYSSRKLKQANETVDSISFNINL